jgi:hypothetical protein
MSWQCYHIMKDLNQDGKRFVRELAEMVGSEEEEEKERAEKRQTENTRIVSDAERERDTLKARVAECEALLARCSPKMDPPISPDGTDWTPRKPPKEG